MRTHEEILEIATLSLQGELFTSEGLLPYEFHACFPFLKAPPADVIQLFYEDKPYVFFERLSEAKGFVQEVEADRPPIPVFESAFYLNEEEYAIFLNMKIHLARFR